MNKNYRQDLAKIRTFMFDYDGVLTDGSVFVTSQGDQLRGGNVKDGYAVQHAIKNGYNIVIISGGYSDSMIHRSKALNIKDSFFGVSNKLQTFEEYINSNNISPETVLYMGDDIPDYEVMTRVGLPTCPADAAEEIKQISRYISHLNGGQGCVRDIIEQTMKLHGCWMNNSAFHW